jgi:signal transduction histidine kinase
MPCVIPGDSQMLNRSWFSEKPSSEILSPKVRARLNSFLRDLQQPLTVVSATAQLIELRNLDDETQEDLNLILNSTEQLRNIIAQIREFINPPIIPNP